MDAIAARRALPRRELSIPAIGLGGAALGGLHGPVSEALAAEAIGAAWEQGFRWFDTAPLYGHGLGELRTGAALRDHPRADFVLSTKVGWRMEPLAQTEALRPGSLPFNCRIDYSFDGTLRSIEDSLLRLGLDRLDIAFVHDVDPLNHGEGYPVRFRQVLKGTLPALTRLRDEGVVRAVGIGVNNCSVCLQFLKQTDLDCILIAGRYSLLNREAATFLFPECIRRGVGIIVGAPFNTGILAKGVAGKFNHSSDLPAAVVSRVEAMTKACAAADVSLMAAALQFPLRHSAVVSVLPGVRSAAQLQQIAEAARVAIPESLWNELHSIPALDATPI